MITATMMIAVVDDGYGRTIGSENGSDEINGSCNEGGRNGDCDKHDGGSKSYDEVNVSDVTIESDNGSGSN